MEGFVQPLYEDLAPVTQPQPPRQSGARSVGSANPMFILSFAPTSIMFLLRKDESSLQPHGSTGDRLDQVLVPGIIVFSTCSYITVEAATRWAF